MQIKTHLQNDRKNILKKWFETVIKTYPPDTYQFLKKSKNPFANPVGSTIMKGLEAIFDEIAGDMDRGNIVAFLDPVVRIRAVQDFTASKAVSFIFFLKKVIRESLKGRDFDTDELLETESRIDEVGLMAFEVYSECREKIHGSKADELMNGVYKALHRAGVVGELPGACERTTQSKR